MPVNEYKNCELRDRVIKLETQFEDFRREARAHLTLITEMRSEAVEDRNRLLRRSEYELNHTTLMRDADELKQWRAAASTTIASNSAWIVSHTTVTNQILDRLGKLETWRGQVLGINALIGLIAGGIGAIAGALLHQFIINK